MKKRSKRSRVESKSTPETEFDLEYRHAVQGDPNYDHVPPLTRGELHRLAGARRPREREGVTDPHS